MRSMIGLFFLMIAMVACHPGHHGVLQKKIDGAKNGSSSMPTKQVNPHLLTNVKYEKAMWKTHKEFFVEVKFDEFKKNKCKDCHNSKKKLRADVTKHNEVKLHHAGKETMNCKTCHQKDQVWDLKTLNKKKVSINHPYKVCMQCHFKQADEWSNGVHGKRVGGWYGKKVRKNCTGCHNPHEPGFKSRWPSINPNFSKWKK